MAEIEKKVEKVFEAPAQALEQGVKVFEREEKVFEKPFRIAGEYWSKLGPGLTTGAADDDPSGIATYSQAGAKYGLNLAWLTLFTFPFMAVVQEMCARIGVVSGEGLAANIRKHYPPWVLYVVTILLFIANTFNIAVDLGAMSAASRLLMPQLGYGTLVVFFAVMSLLLQIFTTYANYARYLKYLTLALFSYIAVAFMVHLDWGEVLRHTLVPSFSFTKDELILLCAVLGTTISPYLFFWQTSQEVEENILHGERTIAERRAGSKGRSIREMRIDVWSGMFFSNLIAFFILAACAGTLHVSGITDIATADQAALALKPFGQAAYLFFALGIVGTGLLAVPVLAGSTAYAIAESFGWTHGLYRKLHQAYAFYGVIIVSMVVGIVANFFHLDPIKGLIYAAVANGVIAPVILVFVVRLSSKKSLMGEYVNKTYMTVLGWITVISMAVAGVAALLSFSA